MIDRKFRPANKITYTKKGLGIGSSQVINGARNKGISESSSDMVRDTIPTGR